MQKSIEDMGNVIKTLVMLIPKNPSPRRAPLNNERTNPLHEEIWYEEEPQPIRQNIEVPAAAPRPPLNFEQPATEKYKTLQDQIEELKRIVIRSKESGTQMVDMHRLFLFPAIKLPEKFKMPDVGKFDGIGDPKTHLMNYAGTLMPMGIKPQQLAQLFHRTLTDTALQWFLNLDPSKKNTWDDIGHAFINQYAYNVQLKVTTRELEATKMDSKETFTDFIARWRAKTAKMVDRPKTNQNGHQERDSRIFQVLGDTILLKL